MKKAIMIIVCMVFLSVSSLAFAQDVYITKAGKRYHTELCKLVKNKEIHKHDMDELVEQGYKPCKVCFKENAQAVEKQVKK